MGGALDKNKDKPKPVIQPDVPKAAAPKTMGGGGVSQAARRRKGTLLTEPGGLMTGGKSLLGA